MEKKKLVINTALCDARNISEEILENYDNITINAAAIVTSPVSRALLHRYNVVLNCANVIEAPENADLAMHNGKFVIQASETEGKPAVLLVNGTLTIEPGAEKAVSRYLSIIVNGTVTYPESMSSVLSKLEVNGTTNCYPDNALLLDRTFIVDKVFIKRCKSSDYYAQKRVIIIDPALDIDGMVNKGVRFITGKAIIAESLLEASIPLFSEDTEIITVPDGCRFIRGDATLSKSLLLKYGTKLYISGNLIIGPSEVELLKKLEYINVNGSICLPRSLEDVFAGINAEYGSLQLVRDKCITDKVQLFIDNRMLSDNPGGITIVDCVNLHIAEDVSPELILERLEIRDCVNIQCSPEQRSAVEQIAEAVHIDSSGNSAESPLGNLISGLESLKDAKVINAANYKF